MRYDKDISIQLAYGCEVRYNCRMLRGFWSHFLMVLAALMFFIVLAVPQSPALSASEGADVKKPAKSKPVVPVFLPGAKVNVEVTLALPPGYEFGDDPAVAYTFDAKALKKHPFSVSPLEWKFTREELGVKLTEDGERTTKPARLQLLVDKNAAFGDHEVPATLRVYYCRKDEGFCTWTELPVEFRIRVGKGEKALKEGVLKVQTDLKEKALTVTD